MTGAWFSLLMAGLLEVAWALGLKYSDGFTRLWPSIGTLAAIAASFAFLSLALKAVPFGTALFLASCEQLRQMRYVT